MQLHALAERSSPFPLSFCQESPAESSVGDERLIYPLELNICSNVRESRDIPVLAVQCALFFGRQLGRLVGIGPAEHMGSIEFFGDRLEVL